MKARTTPEKKKRNIRHLRFPKAVKSLLLLLMAMIVVAGTLTVVLLLRMTAGQNQPMVADKDAFKVEDASALPVETPAPEADVVVVDSAMTPAPIIKPKTITDDVLNILLIGSDSREATVSPEGRSDTMMVVSYDKEHNKLTIVSFMRDSQVMRFGEKSKFLGKLNAAFSHGGAGELINTLNLNFELGVTKYVSVGFAGFWVLIDGFEGIEVPLTKEEAYFINWRSAGLLHADDKSKRFELLAAQGKEALPETDGPAVLHGEQALWYSRDRYSKVTTADGRTLGGDAARIERQQTVIRKVFKKATSEFTFDMLVSMYRYASEWIATNLDFEEMMILGYALTTQNYELEFVRVPFEGTFTSPVDEAGNATTSLVFDIADTRTRLHEVLYGK